jgi:hypothetical protein
MRSLQTLALAASLLALMPVSANASSASTVAVSSQTTGSWFPWESLGGKLATRPVATSWGPNEIDVFWAYPTAVMDSNSERVFDTSWSGSGWAQTVMPSTGYTQNEPSAATDFAFPGEIDEFNRGVASNHGLNWAYFDAGQWHGGGGSDGCIGGSMLAEPSGVLYGYTVSGTPYFTDEAYVEGADHQLWQWWRNGSLDVCGSWHLLKGLLSAAPAAIHIDSNSEDVVFVRGQDGALWYWSSVSGWKEAGGQIVGKPAVSMAGGNGPYAFVQGIDGALWEYSRAGGWSKIGGLLYGVPAPVTSQSTLPLDVFVEGRDHGVWHASSADGLTWHWENLRGYVTSSPTAVSWGAGRLDVFARGRDNALWHRAFQ